MQATFGPDAPDEKTRRREVAIFGHLLTVHIQGYSSEEILPPATVETRGLIDTGASDVCIDYRIALQLGLKAIDQSFVGIVGSSTLATIYLGRLLIPEIQFDRIMPLYALKVRQPTHDVLVGRSVLQNYLVTFDGPAGMMQVATHTNQSLLSAIEDDHAT